MRRRAGVKDSGRPSCARVVCDPGTMSYGCGIESQLTKREDEMGK